MSCYHRCDVFKGGEVSMHICSLTTEQCPAGVLCGREVQARLECCSEKGSTVATDKLDGDGVCLGTRGVMWGRGGELIFVTLNTASGDVEERAYRAPIRVAISINGSMVVRVHASRGPCIIRSARPKYKLHCIQCCVPAPLVLHCCML